jgi:hypothetical protein
MTISKVASLTTSNANGSTFTVPAGVTAAHLGVLILGTANANDQFTVAGWTSRVLNPTGVNNMSFQVFTRLGGLTAGNTFSLAYNSGTPATQVTAVWFDTGLRDVGIVGTTWARAGTSQTTVTVPSINTTVASDVILISQERTTASGTTISTVSPAATQDVYYESNVTNFPTTNTDTSHYVGHIAQSAAGATGDYTLTYSGGSGNGVGLAIVIAPPPKAETWVDTFGAATVDTNRYTLTFPSSVSIVNGRLAVVANGEGPEVISIANLDLTGSSLCLEVIPAPGTVDPTEYTVVRIYPTSTGQSNYIQFGFALGSNNRIDLYTNASTGPSVAYSPNNHRWIRFRHVSGTTVAFEASPIGLNGTWTELWRTDAGFALGSVKLDLSATTGMNTGGSAYFDNINNPPPGYAYTKLFTYWDGTQEVAVEYLDPAWNYYFPSSDPGPIVARTTPLYAGTDVLSGPYTYPYPEYAPYPSTSLYPSAVNEFPNDGTYPGANNYPVSLYPNSEQYPGTYYPGGN